MSPNKVAVHLAYNVRFTGMKYYITGNWEYLLTLKIQEQMQNHLTETTQAQISPYSM